MDHHDVSMLSIKNIISYVLLPLAYIFNLCLINGTFPDKMKIAKIIPVFKKGKREEISNYRPIALLSQFSKILEKLFSIKLSSFLKHCEILSPAQFGFRQSYSTSYALLNLCQMTYESIP